MFSSLLSTGNYHPPQLGKQRRTGPWPSAAPHQRCLSSSLCPGTAEVQLYILCHWRLWAAASAAGTQGASEISHRLATGQWLWRQISQPSVLVTLCTEPPRTGTSLINCSEFSPGWFRLEWCLRYLGWLGRTRDGFGRRTLRWHPIPLEKFPRKWFQALHSAACWMVKDTKWKGERFKVHGLAWIWIGTFFPMKTSKQVARTVHPPFILREFQD